MQKIQKNLRSIYLDRYPEDQQSMEKEGGDQINIFKETLWKDLSDSEVMCVIVPNGPESSCIFYCATKKESATTNEQSQHYVAVAASVVQLKIQSIKTNCLCRRTGVNGIVVAGNKGTIFATIKGEQLTTMHQLPANLPKKQARGNLSSVAFARLRMKSRQEYLSSITQTALSLYFQQNEPTIDRLFIGALVPFSKQMLDLVNKLRQTRHLYAQIVQIKQQSEHGLKEVELKTVYQRNEPQIIKHQELSMSCTSYNIMSQPILAIYGRNQSLLLNQLLNSKNFTLIKDKLIIFEINKQENAKLSMSIDQEMLNLQQVSFIISLMTYLSTNYTPIQQSFPSKNPSS